MGQQSTLRALDASLHTAFARAGIAETGTYTPPAGSPVACRGYRDDVTLDQVGDLRPVVGTRIVATLLRDDVATPVKGATWLVDGVTLTLESKVAEDQGVSRWICRG